MAHDAPLIPACRLWERTSSAGNPYLVGRLGGLRILVLQNRDRQGEDDASHVLVVTTAPERQPSDTAPSQATVASASSGPSWQSRPGAHDGSGFDDAGRPVWRTRPRRHHAKPSRNSPNAAASNLNDEILF
jgi:hypothetical protein